MDLITPVLAKAKSKAISLPAKAPVWDEAAEAPKAEVPDLRIIIGFFLQASGIYSKNALPSITDSRYNKMIFVLSSSQTSLISSTSWTSHLFPNEMKFEKPILLANDQSKIAVNIAPD